MQNINFDTTNFSEQLGIYDFFNVLLAGAIFVCGYSAISKDFNAWLWSSITFPKGLGIVLVIYIVGMILQELGAIADRYVLNIYRGMSRSILKGKIDSDYNQEVKDGIFSNPILLESQRQTADKLLKGFISDTKPTRFENDYFSGAVFSLAQYYVSVKGVDRKAEKLRALFAMSKTLIVCFALLAIISLISIIVSSTEIPVNLFNVLGLPCLGCKNCSGKALWTIIFSVVGYMFYLRAKRAMKNFLLILLGTYDALIRAEKNEQEVAEV